MKYVVIKKHPQGQWGKLILMSFAQCALWKSFWEIAAQDDTLPGYLDKKLAQYALKKYGGGNSEVITLFEAQKQYEEYLKQRV